MRVVIVASVITLFALILGWTTIVSTRNIGVITTFGRPAARGPTAFTSRRRGIRRRDERHHPEQRMPGRGGESDVAPLGCWPNTTTARTVPARWGRSHAHRVDGMDGAGDRVPDQSGEPKTSSDHDDDGAPVYGC